MAVTKATKPKEYWLVNPAGAVHQVTRAHARMRLKTVGWRLATIEEVKQAKSQRLQTWKKPIATPWSPEPDAEPELE